jgi:hypothetical protein
MRTITQAWVLHLIIPSPSRPTAHPISLYGYCRGQHRYRKKSGGTKWLQVGLGFTEGYYSSNVSLAFGLDGTPYIAYTPSFPGQNIATVSVRKLAGDNWVKVSATLGTGVFPSLATGPDDALYIGYAAGYGYGLRVKKITNTWDVFSP